MITKADLMSHLGTAIAGLTVVSAMFQSYFPCELRGLIMASYEKFVNFMYPYIQITFLEYPGDYGFERNKAYAAIERYLNANSTIQAKRLQANVFDDSEAIVFSVANNQEVTDEFKGIKLWWTSSENTPNKQSISLYPRQDEKRYFKLTFYRKHREIITAEYLKHVLEKGKAITVQERLRKLYTNNKLGGWSLWSHVVFEHPATFDTLAMDPDKKQGIINDLLHFSKSKDYYAKMGKAWKRGYLLYGPPGTGKSTMIAAMANLLKYDVDDLELTAVRDNTELRKLLINTSSKSVIVIEDIDCSLDLTGQREKKKDNTELRKLLINTSIQEGSNGCDLSISENINGCHPTGPGTPSQSISPDTSTSDHPNNISHFESTGPGQLYDANLSVLIKVPSCQSSDLENINKCAPRDPGTSSQSIGPCIRTFDFPNNISHFGSLGSQTFGWWSERKW